MTKPLKELKSLLGIALNVTNISDVKSTLREDGEEGSGPESESTSGEDNDVTWPSVPTMSLPVDKAEKRSDIFRVVNSSLKQSSKTKSAVAKKGSSSREFVSVEGIRRKGMGKLIKENSQSHRIAVKPIQRPAKKGVVKFKEHRGKNKKTKERKLNGGQTTKRKEGILLLKYPPKVSGVAFGTVVTKKKANQKSEIKQTLSYKLLKKIKEGIKKADKISKKKQSHKLLSKSKVSSKEKNANLAVFGSKQKITKERGARIVSVVFSPKGAQEEDGMENLDDSGSRNHLVWNGSHFSRNNEKP